MKKMLIFIGIAFILLVGGGIAYMLSGTTMSPQRVAIRDISVSNNQVNIKGFYGADSAIEYCGYKTKYNNGSLYVTFKGRLVRNNTGSFDIKFDNTYGTINEIYIQGKYSEENVLIWSKNK